MKEEYLKKVLNICELALSYYASNPKKPTSEIANDAIAEIHKIEKQNLKNSLIEENILRLERIIGRRKDVEN